MYVNVFYVKILKTNLNKTIFALNIKIKVLFTMTTQKFEIEINTLKKFFEVYCNDKHENQIQKTVHLEYKNEKFSIDLSLCEDCHEAISYSFERLDQCPHEIKPRCRTCPSPCYEKSRWKNIAKVMKYAAIKLSLTKMKNKIKNIFS